MDNRLKELSKSLVSVQMAIIDECGGDLSKALAVIEKSLESTALLFDNPQYVTYICLMYSKILKSNLNLLYKGYMVTDEELVDKYKDIGMLDIDVIISDLKTIAKFYSKK